MFLYIKTNILRGYGIFKNDFAHPREPATTSGDPRPQPPDLLTSCPRYLKVKGPEAAQEFIPKTSLWNLVFCTSLAVAVAIVCLIYLAKQALATSLWFII